MRRPVNRIAIAALAVACAYGALWTLPGPAAAQSGRFEDTAEVTLVEIPVQVIHDGKPVRGLTADNFEVVDGRQQRQIVAFDAIDLSLAAEEEALPPGQVPVTARRHFLLLFDLSFSDPESVSRARGAASELVEKGLHPTDVVAVATYSESKSAQLVLGFTSDRRQVRLAIDTLGLVDPVERIQDPLRLLIADPDFAPTGSGDAGGGPGFSRQDAFIQQVRELSALTEQANKGARQGQVLALTSAMSGLARMMDAAKGRKHVVFLSEGFDDRVLFGTSGTSNEERQRIAEINEQAASGEFWAVDSDERFGSSSTLGGLDQMLEEFRRADCIIQAVDIGGLRANTGRSTSTMGNQGLFRMAKETGGEYFENFNNLSQAMGEVLERTAVTYVLGFQPEDLEFDGKYHRVKVKLKDAPRGARVVHRPGYYAPQPYSEQNALQRGLSTAGLVVGGVDGGALDAAVLAAPFAIPGEKAYVPVLIEVDGPSLLASQLDVIPAELYAYAIGADGQIKDFFTQALGLDAKKYADMLRRAGFKFWGSFDLAPGDYTVRVVVRNSATGDTGVASAAIRVPGGDASIATLLPPLFPEPQGKWLLGREQGGEQRDVGYPFVIADQPYIPAARPVVTPRGQSQVSLVGYNLGNGELDVEARLYTAAGELVPGAELVVDPSSGGSGNPRRMVGVFRPGDLAAGGYRLEVSVRDAATGSALSSVIPIRVQG